MAKNFPNLKKKVDTQVQEAENIPPKRWTQAEPKQNNYN